MTRILCTLWFSALVLLAQAAAPAAQTHRLPDREPHYFRLNPATQDTTYRLLVIPVRFPEDRILGGGERAGLEAKLNGATASLRAYYRAATGGRLRVEAELAPTVVAGRERWWYTCEAGPPIRTDPCAPQFACSRGILPSAYPHNSRRLVEEVTARLADAVDFRRYDNTGDGIADAVLLLHSGPAAPENGTDVPCDALIAHSFELEAPVTRGGAQVFPYAVAATTDGFGVWAHETGHLLGFADLYDSNPLCRGPGLGEWALMATGGNRDEGTDPSGLAAFTRQRLGFAAVPPAATPLQLDETQFLRVYRTGEENGPRYFLVERRTGANGLGLPSPAWLVTLVDETEGANTGCSRFLADLRAVVCANDTTCTTTLDDHSTPSLRDASGRPTGLILRFSPQGVAVDRAAVPAVRVRRVLTSPPTLSEQTVSVEIENLSREPNPVLVSADGGPDQTTWCVGRAPGGQPLGIELAPLARVVVGPWLVRNCIDGPLTAGTLDLHVHLNDPSGRSTDTLAVVLGQNGLEWTPDAFTVETALPSRDPWRREGGGWRAGNFLPFADAALVSPRFRVPEAGVLVLDHAWDLEFLSPDLALDGAQVLLEREGEPPVPVAPDLPWGYEPLRTGGSGLAGLDALSGRGDRTHLLDLDAFAGESVRLRFRAASDFDGGTGFWMLRSARVAAGHDAFAAIPVAGTRTLRVAPRAGTGGAWRVRLYDGDGAVTPTHLVADTTWAGTPELDLPLTAPGPWVRYAVVWEGEDARPGGLEARTTVAAPGVAGGLHVAVDPNPLRASAGLQTWTLRLGPGALPGDYHLRVFHPGGRLVSERSVRIDQPGTRTTSWDARDLLGTPVAAGVYILQAQAPDGTSRTRKLVVIP